MKKILLILLFNCSIIWGIDIKLEKCFELSQEDIILQRITGFAVNQDRTIILCDSNACDLKLYDDKGSFIKVFFRKGFGPNEYGKLVLMDYANSRLLVNDWIKWKYFLYKWNKGTELEKLKEFRGISLKARLLQDRLLVFGQKVAPDGKITSLYMWDLKKDKIDHLLSIQDVYGLPPANKISKKLRYLAGIGTDASFDIIDRHVFFCWIGNLSIINLDLGTHTLKRFGKKTGNYITPSPSPALKKARREQNSKKLEIEDRKMSFVIALFAHKDWIGVVYNTYNQKESMWRHFLQFYTTGGTFISEKMLDGGSDIQYSGKYFLDKAKSTLYQLSRSIDGDLEDVYKVYKYKIGK